MFFDISGFWGKSVLKFGGYFFKACGLATVKLQTKYMENKKIKYSTFARSYLALTYNAFLIFFLSFINYYIIPYSYMGGPPDRIKFDRVFDTFRMGLTYVTSCFVLVWFFFKVDRLLQIANNIKTLNELSVNTEDEVCLEQRPIVWILTKIFLINGVTWLAFILTTEINLESLIYFITIYASDFVITGLFIHYSVTLRLIEQVFKIINASFSDISQKAVRCLQIFSSSDFITETKMSKFSRLRDLHMSLCDVAEDVSNFYSQPTLLCTGYVFISLILYAYYISKPWVIQHNSLGEIVVVHCSFQILIYIVALTTLTKSVTAVVLESKRTGKIVNKWMGNSQNHLIILQLNQFSNYLLHQNLQFSVVDLFPLNGSLIMSITGSITTYMVILLQFQDKKS